MLLPLPDNILTKYKQKLEIAKKNLKKPQKTSVSQKEVENEIHLIRKKFAEVENYIGGEQKKNTETLTKTQEVANQQKETENELRLIQKKLAELESYIGSERHKNTENQTKHQDIARRHKETESELRLIQKKLADVESHIEDEKKKRVELLTKYQETERESVLVQKKFAELESYKTQTGSDIESLKAFCEAAIEERKKAESEWLGIVHERFLRVESYIEDEKKKNQENERARASDIEELKKTVAGRLKEMESELNNLSLVMKKFADFVSNFDYEKKEEKNYAGNWDTEALKKAEDALSILIEKKFAEIERRIETEKKKKEAQDQIMVSEIGNLRKIQEIALEHQKEIENRLLSLVQQKTALSAPRIGIETKEEEKKHLIVLGIEKSGKVHDMTQEIVEHQREAKNELLSLIQEKFVEFESRIETEKKKREAQELAVASEIGNLRKIQEMVLEHQKEMENKLLNIIQEKFADVESHIDAEKKKTEDEEQERRLEIEHELGSYIDGITEKTEEKTEHKEETRIAEPEDWIKKAEAAFTADEKIRCYTKAIELSPKDTCLYFRRGEIHDKRGEYDKAIADYSEIIRLDPKSALAYNNRGAVHYRQNRCDRAIADYTDAIRLDPLCPLAYTNRGIVYYHQGDYDKAIKDYSEAVRCNPKYARAYNNRGSAYYSKRKYNKAIADYSKAIELDPEYAGAYHNRGNLYKKIGRAAEAKKDIGMVINLKQQQRS
jgi:tetratricopeptide (TPR) repeat protein